VENQLYDHSPMIHRPRLELPDGKRLAFWIGLNIEHYELDKPSTSIFGATATLQPDPLNYGWRDYGPRVGIWRTMQALDRYGIRASVLLNSDVPSRYPEIIEEGNKRDWIWLAHGKNNSILQAGMTEDEERQYLTDVVSTIRDATGQQPRGWLGPALTETFNTPNILADLGVDYLLDWCNDDQPYPMHVKQGRLISLPYAIEMNDIPMVLGKGFTGPQFAEAVIDSFDLLYAEGAESARVMCLALHPFITGQPSRHAYLEKVLEHVAKHDEVWLATSNEIADWYYQNYYDQARPQAASAR
jgi:allantoinase